MCVGSEVLRQMRSNAKYIRLRMLDVGQTKRKDGTNRRNGWVLCVLFLIRLTQPFYIIYCISNISCRLHIASSTVSSYRIHAEYIDATHLCLTERNEIGRKPPFVVLIRVKAFAQQKHPSFSVI